MGTQKLFSIVFLIGTSLILSACAEPHEPDEVKYNVPKYHYDSVNRATEAAADWTVSCADSANCPNTVGQLIVRSGSTLGVCTATLISNDVVVTNSHCFNVDDMDPNELCRSGAAVVFATNSPSGKEIAECGSVLIKSKIAGEEEHNFRNPDFLILKLKKPMNRGFEKIDRQGMPDGLKLTIKKVNPEGRGYGILETAQCEVVHGTFLTPASSNALSAIHVMKNCEIIPGNSGSSLFDESGKIRGLAFASISTDKLGQVADAGSRDLLLQAKKLKPGIITNGACIDWDQTGHLPLECSKGRAESEQLGSASEDLENQLNNEVRRFRADPKFGYKFQIREGRNSAKILSYRPYCFKKESDMPTASAVVSVLGGQVKISSALSDRLKLAVTVSVVPKSCEYSMSKMSWATHVESEDLDCIAPAPRVSDNYGLWGEVRGSENWEKCRE